MIKFENTSVMNFENAIRGARNPLASWGKSDSYMDGDKFIFGENDLRLAQNLIRGGSEHRKFMRQIFVCVDITAPLYWWKEFDTYKVGTTADSCSTMHKIAAKEFTFDDFSHEYLLDDIDREWGGIIPMYILESTINALNMYREKYLETKDKLYWWQLIQLLPSSYNQMRTITMSYENVFAMVHQRRSHKLDEWRIGFIDWAKSLPYAKELIFLDIDEEATT